VKGCSRIRFPRPGYCRGQLQSLTAKTRPLLKYSSAATCIRETEQTQRCVRLRQAVRQVWVGLVCDIGCLSAPNFHRAHRSHTSERLLQTDSLSLLHSFPEAEWRMSVHTSLISPDILFVPDFPHLSIRVHSHDRRPNEYCSHDSTRLIDSCVFFLAFIVPPNTQRLMPAKDLQDLFNDFLAGRPQSSLIVTELSFLRQSSRFVNHA